MATAVSPLAPPARPQLPAIEGVRLAVAAAGIRQPNRADGRLGAFAPGTTVAGVFTQSKCPSAPVDWCRAHLKGGTAGALVVHSGHAHALNGKSGRAGTKLTAAIASKAIGCKAREVFL